MLQLISNLTLRALVGRITVCITHILSVFRLFFIMYLFVRAPFAQRRSTEEGRPDTVVELWAVSVQCIARVARAPSLFSAGVDETTSRVFLCEALFFRILCFFKYWCFAHTVSR